jgi:Ni/Co efflux regulator RcnB
MKKIITATLALVIAGSTALLMTESASARGLNQTQNNQQNRIYRGVRSGSLTPQEAYRLKRQQGRIRAQESRFKSDGYLSNRERRVLKGRLSRSSNNIYRLKHNGRRH